ncbi:type VI secretion system tip protein TssI/VgrG, partial [Escherichia coli]|uniref:type VI secretion system tip protein TssI/VgrG n=11 Tax=Escherichia coli TaxID=562 RepID=UPI000B50F2E3
MSTGLRFTLEVDGLPPDAFAVVSFHLTQSLSSLFSLDLSLVSQQFLSLEFAQVLDKMAYLTVWQGDDVQRRVKGVVTWFELGENDKNQMLYSMKVCPPLWRTGLRQNFRIFQNEDIESILATILKENGVTEWSPLFSEPHPSREFCVQYGETDYDFLCRMAAEEGIFFYEEHAQKSTDQSLVLCDTVRYLPESFEIPWNPNTRTEVSTLCISQFRYSAQIRPSSVVTKDYTFKRPGWAGRFDQEGQYQDYQRTQYEVYDYPGRFKGAHGQNFARWQMDGWRNNAEVARGTSRSPEIWPGRRIVLTGHPQANLNREWQVVASDLHGEQPQAVPGRRGSGTTLDNHFAVIPADRTWRPQPLLKPLVDGPQSAVVTGPAGEEIFCDEHGRVRVKFNWDRYNPSNQESSCWIRVAQAWAGTGFGDYDFLCRMAAEEGIFFYEEHAQKSTDQSLVLCDTVRYLPESFEIPWNPNTRTEVSTLCISQFRYSAQIRPSSVVTKDYTFKRPGWAGRFDQEGQYQDYQRTQYEVYDYPGRFKGAHGQNFARWQMDGWRNNAEVARGTSCSPEIWPGRRIALTGHPQANLNREWQVVASELHGEQPQAVPGRSGSGTTLNNHFAVIPADRTWRPQPLLKPLVDGPQSAVVTGPAGEEIFCDEHGRVRVKFNWDRYNPSNQDSSCWIRVAQAWAGTGFGNLAIPRVGQEVIVDFLNGDPDQPIIMGRTYHQENRTPGSLPGTKTQMTIRSKTYKGSGFNELKFDDATGKEQVYIHAQKNMNTEVLNNRTTDVINNHAETIGNNQMIAVTNNQ